MSSSCTNKKCSNSSGSGNASGKDECSTNKPKRTLKGTFGHLNSTVTGTLFSLDRTISAESSDIRRYIVGNEVDDEEIEFNSSTSGGGDKLKDSGVDAEISFSSSIDEVSTTAIAVIPMKREPQKSQSPIELDYDFYDIDEDNYELSTGLLDELPSGIVDIDGTLLDDKLHVRFGQESDLDIDDDHDSSVFHSHHQEEDVPLKKLNEVQGKPSSAFPTSDSSSPVIPSTSPSSSAPAEKSENPRPVPTTSKGKVSRFLSRRKTIEKDENLLSPQKSLDFRNPYNDNIGFGNNEWRKHVGGGGGPKKSTIRNKSSANNSPGGGYANNNAGNRKDSTSATITSSSTITQHYYPEGISGKLFQLPSCGWGYMILFTAFITHTLTYGLLLSSGIIILNVTQLFYYENTKEKIGLLHAVWIGSISIGISLILSPIWVAICKRKSTRLVAVFGGLIVSLGCLFTSFASQFHQLFLSYGVFIGVGVGLARDSSSLMVGQYFKRKRELVEIILVSSSGFGILLMSESTQAAISTLGWRLGLQAITGCLTLTFFLGSCYRSASLYHPQRRAILHLKNQKRKIKEKEKREDKPPFLDFSCLKSKTLQILLISSAFTSFGIYTPLFYVVTFHKTHHLDGITRIGDLSETNSIVHLNALIGTLWIIGCVLFGLIILQKNQECRVSKQYLCQMASTICGISILALVAVEGFNGLVIFACVYGFSLGSYNYILKIYTYEKVRARHFPRAWSFIQSAQAIPLLISVPISGYLNKYIGWKSGYYVSAISVFIGSLLLFLTDVRKKQLSRKKTLNSSMKTCETTETANSPNIGHLSFGFPAQASPESESLKESAQNNEADKNNDVDLAEKELTCISEEGIADMDFQDVYYDEWMQYFGPDCITSCDKVQVEDCFVSEFDPEHPMLQGRRHPGKRSAILMSPESKSGPIAPAVVAIIGSAAGRIAGVELPTTSTQMQKDFYRIPSKNVKNSENLNSKITIIEETEEDT